MAIPFFSIDFRWAEWRSFLSSSLGLSSRDKQEEKLLELLFNRFPEKKITLFPSARMAFYFVLKNTFKKGDEIIFPVMGFPLYVKIALQLELKPIYVDVEDKHFTINVEQLDDIVTTNTKGIVVTHLFGYPCNMEKVMEVANKHGIPVIEDCAQSYDSFYKGKETGTFGYAGIFSCSLMKVPTTLGGGILLTEDEILHDNINTQIEFGNFNKSIVFHLKYLIKNLVSILNSYPILYSLLSHRIFGFIKKRNPNTLRNILYSGMGLTGNQYNEWERPALSNYQLSVGNVQFKRSRQMTDVRIDHTKILNKKLQDNSNYKLPKIGNENVYWNCQYYVVSIKNDMNSFFDQMFDKGIHLMKEDVWDCSVYEFSKDMFVNFPVARRYGPTLVRIPNSSFLSRKDVIRIANQINSL
jgi:dTDP-4-amino-4,6-dideoxygalactose transaminase